MRAFLHADGISCGRFWSATLTQLTLRRPRVGPLSNARIFQNARAALSNRPASATSSITGWRHPWRVRWCIRNRIDCSPWKAQWSAGSTLYRHPTSRWSLPWVPPFVLVLWFGIADSLVRIGRDRHCAGLYESIAFRGSSWNRSQRGERERETARKRASQTLATETFNLLATRAGFNPPLNDIPRH